MSYNLNPTDQPDRPTYADIVRRRPVIESQRDRDQWDAAGPSAEEWLREEPPFTQGVNEMDATYYAERGQEDNRDKIEAWREKVAMDMVQGEKEAEWPIGENEDEGSEVSEGNEEEEEEVVDSLLQD
ncbi:hypothetical protein AX14_005397 [Amanita brunnescens Koide BX004]|nr:hypothetical protein AX14_005397 [Amanita brunnescens Koide BX004]